MHLGPVNHWVQIVISSVYNSFAASYLCMRAVVTIKESLTARPDCRASTWMSSSAARETKDCNSTLCLQNVLQKWQESSLWRTSHAAMWSGMTIGLVLLLNIMRRCWFSLLATTGSDTHTTTPFNLISMSSGPLPGRHESGHCRNTWTLTWLKIWLACCFIRWGVMLFWQT